jgi:hypothetical protein
VMNKRRSGCLVAGLFMTISCWPTSGWFGMGLAHSNDRVTARHPDRPVSSGTSDAFDRYSPLDTDASGPARCEIYAAGPPRYDKQDRVIIGVGGRGDYCASSTRISVSLKTYGIVSGPGATLITARRTVTNREVVARYPCKFPVRGLVFVEVESEGRKVRSGSVNMEADTKDCRP